MTREDVTNKVTEIRNRAEEILARITNDGGIAELNVGDLDVTLSDLEIVASGLDEAGIRSLTEADKVLNSSARPYAGLPLKDGEVIAC